MERIPRSVSVVVLGDVGRSPRMQYHSLSLANEGYDVDLIGYAGSQPIKELEEHPRVRFRNVALCPNFQNYCPRLLAYILKVIWQSVTLFFTILFKRRSHHVLVQNPPGIPALAICWLYCLLMDATFIIDWHNYGYSIMALTLGSKHRLVSISEWFEGYFGRKATANLCVTKAMKQDLKIKWDIVATTLYDRPPESFKSVSVLERHELFTQLAKQYASFGNESEVDETTFTKVTEGGQVQLKGDRPGLLVSSTSWTEDEDFSILLSALQDYEDTCSSNPTDYPFLVCVITGKGPLKEHYCQLIEKRIWKHVQVITPWLLPEDYPRLLACADLGVCLHTSSSGLDLPMKIADMFGCGLPVCAYDFLCLDELVYHEENSYKFSDNKELSSQIQTWFMGFPTNQLQQEINSRFRGELEKYRQLRWHDNWTFHALSLFK